MKIDCDGDDYLKLVVFRVVKSSEDFCDYCFRFCFKIGGKAG